MYGIWDFLENDWVRSGNTHCIGFDKAILVFEDVAVAQTASCEWFGKEHYGEVLTDRLGEIRSIYAHHATIDLEDGGEA